MASERKAQLFLSLPELLIIYDSLDRRATREEDALTSLHLAAVLEVQHKIRECYRKYLKK